MAARRGPGRLRRADLTANAWAGRGVFVLGVCLLGALVYGGSTGVVSADPTPESELTLVPETQSTVRISPCALVPISGYLVHVLGWVARAVSRRRRPGAQQHRVSRGTADSAA